MATAETKRSDGSIGGPLPARARGARLANFATRSALLSAACFTLGLALLSGYAYLSGDTEGSTYFALSLSTAGALMFAFGFPVAYLFLRKQSLVVLALASILCLFVAIMGDDLVGVQYFYTSNFANLLVALIIPSTFFSYNLGMIYTRRRPSDI